MMIKRTATLCLILLAANSPAGEWNNPEDIPVIEPVSVGLAGERPADIDSYSERQDVSSNLHIFLP